MGDSPQPERILTTLQLFLVDYYLIKTKDTSGNFSEDLSGYVFTTVKGVADKIIAAFNEDSPGSNFTTITILIVTVLNTLRFKTLSYLNWLLFLINCKESLRIKPWRLVASFINKLIRNP